MGMPKTGTSILQRCLQKKSVVADFPLIYPEQFRERGVAHHALAEALKADGMQAPGIDDLLRSFRDRATRKVFISSEEFTNAIVSGKRQSVIAFWEACSEIVPTKLIVAVRRLDQFMQSMYLQTTRVGRFEGDIAAYVASRSAWDDNFFAGLQAIRKVARDDLVILPYVESFDILSAMEALTDLPTGMLSEGRENLPPMSKLTAKAQTLLLHLASINAELSAHMTHRTLHRAITLGKLSFADDFSDYTILPAEDAARLQSEALQAATDAGISEYAIAFSQIEASPDPFVRLDRALLNDDDMERIGRYAGAR